MVELMDNIETILKQAAEYSAQPPVIPVENKIPVGAEIAGWIDHTLLKPEATATQIKTLCQEALEYRFAAVCVNPVYIPLVAGLLKGTTVAANSVVGFPLGANAATIKAAETLACLEAGATEIDMVMNIGALKGEAFSQVFNDIRSVTQVAHRQGAIVKVILETALLSRKEKIIACLLSKAAGADFVKTSTGFGPAGATIEDVELMRRVVGPQVRVKAAGGIRSYADALAMISAGASRIGTSSGVKIIQEATKF
jgi:deoxyribose-phosphate aldolase